MSLAKQGLINPIDSIDLNLIMTLRKSLMYIVLNLIKLSIPLELVNNWYQFSVRDNSTGAEIVYIGGSLCKCVTLLLHDAEKLIVCTLLTVINR